MEALLEYTEGMYNDEIPKVCSNPRGYDMDLIRHVAMPVGYRGNGCGSGWKEPLVPDELGGIDISEACGIHDYEYEIGGTEEDREISNLNFLCNMVLIIRRDDTWMTNEGVALKWAMHYYMAVEEYGKEYFNYHN